MRVLWSVCLCTRVCVCLFVCYYSLFCPFVALSDTLRREKLGIRSGIVVICGEFQ